MCKRAITGRLVRLVLFCAITLSLVGCASLQLDSVADDLPAVVNLDSVPFYPQTEFHCGPAALATVLEHSGHRVGVDALAARVYTPELRGSLQAEMVATARSKGRLVYRLPGEPRAVLAEVASGRPVLVLENLGLESQPYWHYAVLVGYDRQENTLLLRSGETREQRISAGRWLRRWDRAGRWAVVLLAPGEWPAEPERERERWMAAAADFEAVGNADEAATVWQQTLDRWPDAALAWLGLGNVEFSRDDHDAAITAYRQLLRIQPDHAAGRFNLAVALERSGNPCDALPVFETLKMHDTLGERAREGSARAALACRISAP